MPKNKLFEKNGSNKKYPPRKLPPRKFPPITLPPAKSARNIPTHFIDCLSSLNTSF